MSWLLADMLGDRVDPITIVDVGALFIGDEHVPYRALLAGDRNRVIGFEPSEAACRELRERHPRHTFLPCAVGDGSEATLHVCEPEMTSSLYEPNTVLHDRFEDLASTIRVRARIKVSTRRLDDLPEVAGADYLKLDVQGAELDVCRGAKQVLGNVVAVHTEVEFIPLYVDQPLFADVDRELRARGFLFHSFTGVATRTFRPVRLKTVPAVTRGQYLWADALYVRSFLELDHVSPASLLKLAVIAHDVYHAPDLAGLALQHHDEQTGADLWHAYMLKLTGKEKVKPPLR
jgi:FkbM family methyltransferase